MGCGTSRGVQVLEEEGLGSQSDAQITQPEAPTEEEKEVVDIVSVHSGSPDKISKPVESPKTEAPILNGTSLTPTRLSNGLTDPSEDSAPTSAGTRAVAFEVGDTENGESLIKRHPPRKFQKLEDLQQGPTLTQEKLEEKQAIAERRRQEILSQRVQSAKQRSARSAGRMRTRNIDGDEVETLDDGIIESAASINPENEL